MSDDWDAVTFQQVSGQAPHFDTYEPYLSALADYVRTYLPHAKFYLHQTWAYEAGSERLKNTGFNTPKEMLENIRAAYQKAADRIGACGIIPSGDAMFHALENGMEKVHRRYFSRIARFRAVFARPCVVRLFYRKKREKYSV